MSEEYIRPEGYEKERLQYTRIGFPFFDLKEIYENNNKENRDKKILEHLEKEYNDVKNLINLITAKENIKKEIKQNEEDYNKIIEIEKGEKL